MPATDAYGNQLWLTAGPLPAGSPVTNSSGNKANVNAVSTIAAAVTGETAYITGFTCTASGATGALVVLVTVAGCVGGTMTFTFTYPAGAAIAATPLQVTFPQPIPAVNNLTNIVVTLPAGGTGNVNAATVAYGFTY